jgi:hypothetical protein
MAEIQVKTFDDFAEHAKIIGKNGNITECPESIYEFLYDAKEAQALKERKPHLQLWTMVEYEGSEYVWSGFHLVNRTGFLFTEVQATDRMFDSNREKDGMVEILYWDETAKVTQAKDTL